MLPLTDPADSTLHSPKAFRVTDIDQIVGWLYAYPLVTIVSADSRGQPRSSVSPLLLRTSGNQLRVSRISTPTTHRPPTSRQAGRCW
jgi:hypothetical protein